MKKFIYLLSIIIMTSCVKTIDMEDEKEYIKQSNGVISYKGTPFTGKLVSYYDGDKTKLYQTGTVQDGKWDGQNEIYYEDGQLKEKITFQDGIKDGPKEKYYENGQLKSKRTFQDGKKDGISENYDENGQLKEKGTWKDGVYTNLIK